MVRVNFEELLKAVKLLEKDSICGPISISTDGVTLKMGSVDRSGKDMTIELSDLQYPFKPRITRTETF